MKILLVTRGSQGDIYPYLNIASALIKRGHKVTLNLPQIFEKEAQAYQLDYVLQDFDDIQGMVSKAGNKSEGAKPYLKWMRDVIDAQFKQLVPLLKEHDVLIATNSEFAAASVADYCGKPFIRTAFAPFIPGKNIPPPIFPYPKPHPVFTPRMIWRMLNIGNKYMTQKTINKNRKQLGLQPLKNCGYYATERAFNYLLYSRHLGSTDADWKYKWDIGGYCFNDTLHYDTEAYRKLTDFIQQEQRPVIFFTLGSCSAKESNDFCHRLINVCWQLNFRLIIGSGWSGTGKQLANEKDVFLLTHTIPHSLIFPHCDAVMHHGGSGTTHSVDRAGKPQVVMPLIIDQPYWAYRVQQLKIGPARIKIGKVSDKELKEKVYDLVTNPVYKKNAEELGEKIRSEQSTDNFCDFIESMISPKEISEGK